MLGWEKKKKKTLLPPCDMKITSSEKVKAPWETRSEISLFSLFKSPSFIGWVCGRRFGGVSGFTPLLYIPSIRMRGKTPSGSDWHCKIVFVLLDRHIQANPPRPHTSYLSVSILTGPTRTPAHRSGPANERGRLWKKRKKEKRRRSGIKKREEIREGRSEMRRGREEEEGKYYQQEGRSGGRG